MQSPTASGAELLAQNADPSVLSTSKARLHLPYLDGIRALMALYVMQHHLLDKLQVKATEPSLQVSELLMPFIQGHLAVVVFIVLSGYCLMLPVLRDEGTLRGGLTAFFKRRARRIMPPYYAALFGGAIFTLIIVFVFRAYPLPPDLKSPSRWLLHLLLLHNLSWQHIYEFNGALWSIATEWQIYFVFPLLFLPVWKRGGEAMLLAVAAVFGAGLTLLFPSIAKGCPWFVFLFALGMVAAKWSLEPTPRLRRVPWIVIGLVLTVAAYLALRFVPDMRFVAEARWQQRPPSAQLLAILVVPDIIFGVATVCFLMHGTRATLDGRSSRFVRAFTWRPLVFLGAFSYSIYLIHLRVQEIIVIPLSSIPALNHSRLLLYIAMLLVYVPINLASAYVFYLAFEKPFIGAGKPRKSAPSLNA